MIVQCFRVDRAMRERVAQTAKRKGMTESQLIRDALKEYFEGGIR